MRNVVLVAHVDPAIVEKYCNALDAAGFNCLAANNGSDALATGLSYAPQFAVLAEELGDVQGTDVGLRLKQEKSTYLLLIGSDDMIGHEVGADVLLPEPLAAPDLVKELKALHAKIARSVGRSDP